MAKIPLHNSLSVSLHHSCY